ncbi:MAG TPA: hypothetical protein VIL46_00940 [Gemmataceae bacterium]
MPTLLPALGAVLIGLQSPSPDAPRQRNPLAPSLPLLTEKEEAQLDAVIDRFILYDTGQLAGAEGKKALRDFHNLGPEATFALIRGLNKAARIEHSCPALTIGRKLAGILRATQDVKLLEYARENIGLGVGNSRHRNVLDNLKLTATTRKGQLQRSGAGVLRTRP